MGASTSWGRLQAADLAGDMEPKIAFQIWLFYHLVTVFSCVDYLTVSLNLNVSLKVLGVNNQEHRSHI